MSNYPQPGYPPGQPGPAYPQGGYPPERPGSGCGCGGCLGKFLILLGIVFLLLVALCCGIVYEFKSSFTDQPAAAKDISDEITSIRVPPPLEPVGGGRLKVPVLGKLIGEGVIYSDKEHTCVVVLGSFGDALGQKFKDQLLESMESGQFQQKATDKNKSDKSEELRDEKKTRLERTIRGQNATFQITEGVGVETKKRKIRVQGAFLGKTGPAILVIETEEKTLPLDKVKELIESIE